jgi:hypothetical protein
VAVSMMVLGELRRVKLRLAYLDAMRQRYTLELTPVSGGGEDKRGKWREMAARLPPEVDYPVELESIYVFSQRRRQPASGRILIDEIAAHHPPVSFVPLLCGRRGPCACPAAGAAGNGAR